MVDEATVLRAMLGALAVWYAGCGLYAWAERVERRATAPRPADQPIEPT